LWVRAIPWQYTHCRYCREEVAVKTRVQRWGNSLAVRIPKSFAEEVGLMDGSPVEMRLVEGALLVEPAAAQPPCLDELLDGITSANLHAEVDSGPAQGSEVW
jgi:antitoxin MazE